MTVYRETKIDWSAIVSDTKHSTENHVKNQQKEKLEIEQ
jgi:hypothetical protein